MTVAASDSAATGAPSRPASPPPLRSFLVRRRPFGGSIEEFPVFAHSIQWDDGILFFLVISLVEGEQVIKAQRAFKEWLEFEEIDIPVSQLIH